jgi:hypothetical protein
MGDKAVLKAQTGALKYALRNAFLVPDDTDPEGDETTDKAAQTVSTARPTNPSPAKATQPPKAEIPNAAPAASSTIVVSASKIESATSTGNPASSYETPLTEDDLVGLRNRFKLLGDDLASAGLKARRGLPINRLVLAYLLKTTSAPAADKINRTQWNTFFQITDAVKSSEGGIKELVRLVNEATPIQEEKK